MNLDSQVYMLWIVYVLTIRTSLSFSLIEPIHRRFS